MKVIIFGAAGKTGCHTVERALEEGHRVTVFLHGPHPMPPGVNVVIGDAEDNAAVRKAVHGQDAVIDAVGGKAPYRKTELERSVAENIIDAMQREGVKRLIVVSAMGIGDSKAQAPFWYDHLLLPVFLHGTRVDKAAMEDEVKASGLEFVIARPPVLNDDAATGEYRILNGEEKGHQITRADLAHFLVDQLTSNTYLGQAVVVVNS